MAAPKFTPAQVQANLFITEEMYFCGRPQKAIAERLGVRQQTIGYYLGKLNRIWQEKHADKLDAHKARELARLDHVEREYWRAWERSQADSETATQEQVDGKTKVSLSKRGQAGDPRFLEGILRCIEMRLKIVGGFAILEAERLPTQVVFNILYGNQVSDHIEPARATSVVLLQPGGAKSNRVGEARRENGGSGNAGGNRSGAG